MLIPPGVAMILYALQTNASIGAIYLAGLMAGAVFTSVLCGYAYAYVYAWINKVETVKKLSWPARWDATKTAIWALGLPVFVLGGIYGGAFTPTEAAAFAVVYAVIVECLIYRSMPFSEVFRAANQSASISVLLILIAAGNALTYYLTLNHVSQKVTTLLTGASMIEILLIINVVFLITGMFVDPNSAIIVLTPLIFQAAASAGIDPIHLGAIIVANVALGMVSPPFGLNLFIGITTFRVNYKEVVTAVASFIILMLIVLALITYISATVLLLPGLM